MQASFQFCRVPPKEVLDIPMSKTSSNEDSEFLNPIQSMWQMVKEESFLILHIPKQNNAKIPQNLKTAVNAFNNEVGESHVC
jgi:hypothetical protein